MYWPRMEEFGCKTLHRAVKAGNVGLVKFLIWLGANVNTRDSRKRTALHWACESEHSDMQKVIDVLLMSGAEVNVQDKVGRTPLHETCQETNQSAVVTLMRNGAKIGLVDNYSWTPLHVVAGMAMNSAVVSIVKALLANNPAVGSEERSSQHLADNFKDEDMLSAVNLQDCRGDTALHLATMQNNTEVVCLLLRMGAKVGVKNEKGMTALHRACEKNNKEIVCLLLHMVGVKDSTETTALQWAGKCCTEDVVHVLVDNSGCVDAKNSFGNTPLHVACMKNAKEIVCLLLHMGAKVGVKNNGGMTALHCAAEACAEDVVEVLVDNGEDVNAKDFRGNIALHLACSSKCYNVSHMSKSNTISNLLSKGARVYERNVFLKTPYEELGECYSSFGRTIENEGTVKIEETFIKHVIKMSMLKARAGFSIEWKLGPDFYEDVINQCCHELENMKSTKVLKDVSLYKVLLHANKPYLLSPDDLLHIDEFLCSSDLLNKFPLYGHLLNDAFKRPKLLTLAVQSFYAERRKQVVKGLPCEVAEQLVTFLSNEDLKCFIKSE